MREKQTSGYDSRKRKKTSYTLFSSKWKVKDTGRFVSTGNKAIDKNEAAPPENEFVPMKNPYSKFNPLNH